MDRLFEFFTVLSTQPFRQMAFAAEPAGALAGAGLAAADLEALARWTQGEQSRAIAGGDWFRCAACGDPGPDPLPDPDIPMF